MDTITRCQLMLSCLIEACKLKNSELTRNDPEVKDKTILQLAVEFAKFVLGNNF